MKQVALELKFKSVEEKINLGHDVSAKIDGNANFPNSDPTPAEIETATVNLDKANKDVVAIRTTAKDLTAILNKKEAEYDEVMTAIAKFVEVKSKGDVEKIKSSGLTPKSDGVHSQQLLPQVQHLSATIGELDHEIDLHWDKVDGAISYDVEMTTDTSVESSWHHVKTPTKSSTTIQNLANGTLYYFRVSAVNTNGNGQHSETASKVRY